MRVSLKISGFVATAACLALSATPAEAITEELTTGEFPGSEIVARLQLVAPGHPFLDFLDPIVEVLALHPNVKPMEVMWEAADRVSQNKHKMIHYNPTPDGLRREPDTWHYSKDEYYTGNIEANYGGDKAALRSKDMTREYELSATRQRAVFEMSLRAQDGEQEVMAQVAFGDTVHSRGETFSVAIVSPYHRSTDFGSSIWRYEWGLRERYPFLPGDELKTREPRWQRTLVSWGG
jgi:hypothetical protein